MMFAQLEDIQYALTALEASSIISITDASGNMTYVNDQFCAISKYDRSELIGKPHRWMNSVDLTEEAAAEISDIIRKGQVWHGEVKNRAKDNSEYWISLVIVPLLNQEGGIRQFITIGTDITKRKHDEYTLLKTVEKLSDIENALDESSIVAITDSKGVITYVNDKFCEISKYSYNELLGRTHRIVNSGYHPKSFFQTMWETISQGRVWKGEVKNRAKDGYEYWMNTTIVPFLDEQGVPRQYISIRTDITDRMIAEAALAERTEQLAKAHDEAIQASLIKSQFLANMSHELRTPLNAIIGYSEMLQEEAEELGEPMFAEDLARICKAGNHLLSLINDILDISKIEAGKMEMHLEEFILRDLIADVCSTIIPLAESKGNVLVTSTEEDVTLVADVIKLRQILINLLSNANKFTDDGTIRFDIFKEERNGQGGYCFRVADTGIGISPDKLSKLFQPFTQADTSTTRKYGGTGLGLAISKRFTEAMGGLITVESGLGQGSTFCCWLPLLSKQLEGQEEVNRDA